MNDNLDKIINIYNIRMTKLGAYSTLVWNRFNWLVTLQIALLGFFFSQIDKKQAEIKILFEISIPVIGLVLSVLWLMLGKEDYFTLKKQKEEIKCLSNIINEKLNLLVSLNKKRINFSQSIFLFLFPILTFIVPVR